ncbi:MAG: SsrA-binding protein SmpB [Bacilli bacterium]
MSQEEKNIKVVARNKKASYDYFIIDTYEVGIVLTGTEIKSIRNGKVSIQEAYCDVRGGELIVHGMNISRFKEGNIFNHEEAQDRKLLAHKREIRKIDQKVTLEGLTIVPLEIILKNGLAKMNIGICKGKKNYDKREVLKNKELDREKRRRRD